MQPLRAGNAVHSFVSKRTEMHARAVDLAELVEHVEAEAAALLVLAEQLRAARSGRISDRNGRCDFRDT
eukprot:6207611-Pleurochrysis_carterae.AAC.3